MVHTQKEVIGSIKQATILHIGRYGLDSFSLKTIHQQTNLSVNYVYRCFGGKQQLIECCIKDVFKSLMKDILQQGNMCQWDYCKMMASYEGFDIWWNKMMSHQESLMFLAMVRHSARYRDVVHEQSDEKIWMIAGKLYRHNVYYMLNQQLWRIHLYGIFDGMISYAQRVIEGTLEDDENTLHSIHSCLFKPLDYVSMLPYRSNCISLREK